MPVRSAVVHRPTRTVATRVAVAVLALGILLAGVVAGLHLTPVAIYGTSMVPNIRPGDVVLVDRRAQPTLGTVVTYTDDTRWITHRVSGVAPDGSLVLRGDANGWNDPPVALDRAVGVSRLVVPAVGLPVYWAHEGQVLPFVALGALVVLAGLIGITPLRRRLTPIGRRGPRRRVLRSPTPAGPPAT